MDPVEKILGKGEEELEEDWEEEVEFEESLCKTPGRKIRSKGRGRGLGVGKGRGPIGRFRW